MPPGRRPASFAVRLEIHAPFPRVDLVLCRNVLIYFTAELQRRILQLFAFSLRDGGYLILGKSETTSPFAEAFVAHDSRLRVYRRRGEPLVLPATPARESTPATSPRLVPVRPSLSRQEIDKLVAEAELHEGDPLVDMVQRAAQHLGVEAARNLLVPHPKHDVVQSQWLEESHG